MEAGNSTDGWFNPQAPKGPDANCHIPGSGGRFRDGTWDPFTFLFADYDDLDTLRFQPGYGPTSLGYGRGAEKEPDEEDEAMTIQCVKEEGVTIFVLQGRFDQRSVAEVEDAFSATFGAGEKRFVWDFEKVDYISSAGLRLMLKALKDVSRAGGGLVLCAASPTVRQVFEICGFQSLLTVVETRSAAIETLS